MKKQKMWSKRIRRWIFAALVLSGCLVSAFSADLPVFAYSQAVIAASAARAGAATAPQKNSAAGTVSGKAASTTSASGNVPTPTPTLTPTPTPAPKKKSGKWVRKKDYFYYYNENGKKLKNGIFQIGKKKYCFDKKGRQLTGWRKIGKRAYYFRYLNGKKGYMLTNRKVDGIKLKKNGRAAPKGARAKQKLPLLIRVQKLSDKAVRPAMKKSRKLRAVFDYVRDNYAMHTIPELGHSAGDWDLDYAYFLIDHGYGDCYSFAAAFSYFANAVGYQNVLTANDDGHGWTEIDGKYYDAHWAKVIGTDKCYASPASLSGSGGRPNWAAYGCYYRNCDK